MSHNLDKRIKIAVVNILNESKNVAMNKDLNGGFGTADSYSGTFFEKILCFIKKKLITLPIVSLAYLMGIFKQRGIDAKYYEGTLPTPSERFDIILIYGSIVDFRNEVNMAKVIKGNHPKASVGFIGPFPSIMPNIFASLDFVIIGSFEEFFLHEFASLQELKGEIQVRGKLDMNKLPHPELEGFPIHRYGYSPAIKAKPFFSLQASSGCPYSCSHYCVYGAFQGSEVVVMNPKKVVKDIEYINKNYNIKGIQFRDPIFGVKPGYIKEFCAELKKSKVNIEWGIETRLDLLKKEEIRLMRDLGLRNINIGIESSSPDVANYNKRKTIQKEHQEEIIKYCHEIGVKISAFYILGYDHDSLDTMRDTIEYAKKLNTYLARFAILTPYPGTGYYSELEGDGRILESDLEKYTQFNPIIRHNSISPEDLKSMLSSAYKEFYFRPSYILMLLLWKKRKY